MMKLYSLFSLFITAVIFLCSLSVRSESAPEVYFIAPQSGAVVASPFRVVMGVRGMGIAPAGVQVKKHRSFAFANQYAVTPTGSSYPC